jgi:hypothetical protein
LLAVNSNFLFTGAHYLSTDYAREKPFLPRFLDKPAYLERISGSLQKPIEGLSANFSLNKREGTQTESKEQQFFLSEDFAAVFHDEHSVFRLRDGFAACLDENWVSHQRLGLEQFFERF